MDSLVQRLRQFQADEPGFPPLFSAAAEKIEGLQREILRCDEACFERDKQLAEVVREREDYNGKHQAACLEIERLSQRVAVLEMVIREELFPDDCSDEANAMIVENIHEQMSP